ncbi:MAG TPA: DUF4177 domain-containing protein [Microbacteriaceae bacterium]|nr:DUF4177 domain-containing protein [Microbacteriaceae bacterium]
MKYEFESIPVTRRREGFAFASDYRDVIKSRASEGWVFVQAINLETHADPRLELVFTKEGS